MTSETPSSAAQPPENNPTGLAPTSGAGSMAWNQPGFANLWGLATAKDSLKYWLQRKSFSSFILTRWAFAIYFIIIAMNGFVVFNRILFAGENTELASYPLATAVVLMVVLGTTKERSQGAYFWVAWTFWIVVNLIGFVNATSVNEDNYRLVIQVIVKSWISLIGIPWMAFRVISPDKLPRYTKLIVVASTIGSIMCMLQTINPNWFAYIRDNKTTMRGAGTWDNANFAGMSLMFALFLTRFVTWRSQWMKWAVYLILLAGFIGTFSRGAFAGYIVGELVYLLIVRNYKRMLLGGAFMVVFLTSWITIGFLVQNNTIKVESKEIRDRMQTFSNLVSGKAGQELEEGRLYLWRAAMQDVLSNGNLIFGLGHLGMVRSKTLGLAPHNDYIQYFADGGLLGLTSFIAFLVSLAAIFWRCKDRVIRASLVGMIIGFAVFCMSGNSLFLTQMIGAYFAIFVMWSHYSREYPGAEKVHRLKKSLAHNLAMSNPALAKPGAGS